MSILTSIILLPIVAAIAVLIGAPARRTALGCAAAVFGLTLAVAFKFQHGAEGYQFVSSRLLVEQFGLKYLVGLDGLSLLMLLLTAIVTLAAVWVAPLKVERFERLYYASLLLISAGAIGAFCSIDLFFFYAFHELALIPTFLLIGIWGSGDRQAAAWKITIYLALGSFVLLIGLIGLYLSVPAGSRTLDLRELQALAANGSLGGANAHWIYLLLLIGFGILISLFPFHTWAPQAYASAPTPAAMLHAGVLKKFGLYGLLRVALPLLPAAAREWADLLLILLVGNIIYVGLATIAQRRLDLMLGYSSVMHMGYIFLGLATFNIIGVSGASLLMFAHGLSIAALFAIAGEVRQRTNTLEFSDLGGLAKAMPFLGLTFGLAAFASIGLPGFANFASELMVFFGAFNVRTGGLDMAHFQWATVAGLWGVVISAVYMLRGYKAVFMGEPAQQWKELPDATRQVRLPLMLLLGSLLLAGFVPRLFLNFVSPALKALLALS